MKISEIKWLTNDILAKMMRLSCYLIFMPKERRIKKNWGKKIFYSPLT